MTDTDHLLAQIAGLQRQVAELQQQVAQLTTVEPNNAEDRFVVTPNTTYDAAVTGYLSVSSTDGRTARVELLVGYEDPPTECVGVADSRGGSGAPTSARSSGKVRISCSTRTGSAQPSQVSSHPSSDEPACATTEGDQ